MFLAPTTLRAEASHHFLRPAAISWEMLAVAGICCQLARDLHCSRSQRQRRDRCWAAAPTDVPRPKLQLLENCPPLAALVTGDEARYCILASFSKLRFKHSNTARHSTAATFAFHSISLTPCSHQRPVYVSTRGRRFGKLHPRAWATVLLYLARAPPGRPVRSHASMFRQFHTIVRKWFGNYVTGYLILFLGQFCCLNTTQVFGHRVNEDS